MSNSKPPRLTPYAKQLFLHYCGPVISESKNVGHDDKMPNFLKCLVISKGYLFAFQRNKIYELELSKRWWSDGKFVFDLKSFQDSNWPYIGSKIISTEALCKLNQLLKFPFIKVGFDHRETLEDGEEFKQLFKNYLIQGKLDLSFPCWEEDESIIAVPPFLQFSSRIHRLRCNAAHIIDHPPMKLETCDFVGLKNFGQLKSISKAHLTICKKATFRFSQRFDWNIDSTYFDDFPICPRTTDLEFAIEEWKGNLFGQFEKLYKILAFFSNLKKFTLTISGPVAPKFLDNGSGEGTSEEVINIGLDVFKRLVNLKEKFCPSLQVKIMCSFGNTVHEDRETICESMHRLEKMEMFENPDFDVFEYKDIFCSFSGKWRKENLEVYFNFWVSIPD